MVLLTPEEFLGEVRLPQPRHKRLVANLGIAAPGRRARKEAIAEKNKRYWAKLKADPARKKDRSAYMREWRAKNRDRVQQYRDKWKAKNPLFHKVYQRVWRRTKYRTDPEFAARHRALVAARKAK